MVYFSCQIALKISWIFFSGICIFQDWKTYFRLNYLNIYDSVHYQEANNRKNILYLCIYTKQLSNIQIALVYCWVLPKVFSQPIRNLVYSAVFGDIF